MNRSIAKDMASPYTGGRVYLAEGVETKTFRKEEYVVYSRYYECEDTGRQFTTEEQDEQMFTELYNQYRTRHCIPFPDEIREMRERYGLSCQQMSAILGFGQNQWGHYEAGCMPSESNGKAINMVRSKEGMLAMVDISRNEWDEAAYTKIRNKVACAADEPREDAGHVYFYGKTERSLYNGYTKTDSGKLQCMVRMIVSMEKGGVPKTKLNKEMFYSDFLCYRRYRHGISGLEYRAIRYGAVPEHYETVYDHVAGLERRIAGSDMEYELLCCDEPDVSALSEEEKGVINDVMSVLAGMKCSDVVRLNHEEDCWIKNRDSHGFIPYDEAFGLKAFPV